MITRNFKNLLSALLQASTTNHSYSSVPLRDIQNQVYFCSNVWNQNSYPYSVCTDMNLTDGGVGISVGTGTNPESEFDYNLQSTIVSDIALTLASTTCGMDGDNVYLQYTLAVTNNGSSPVTITEVGYKQQIGVGLYPGNSASFMVTFLIDRTLLSSPLTLQSGDAGTIQYRLQVNPMGPKYKEGIKLVSFTYGTDEEIGVLIDAARQGIIDLQADAGWHVGDIRYINIGPWTGGGDISHNAETSAIAISQFGDYNSCGCLFQFDFVDCVAGKQRMNDTNTNTGGYGATEMYNVTLPALHAALPRWLNSRTKEFNVLASKGEGSTDIELVPGNKLALRSEIELFGQVTYSKPGEGSWIKYYSSNGIRIKRDGISSNTSVDWWERSPVTNTFNFCGVSISGTPAGSLMQATSLGGVAPFGCV